MNPNDPDVIALTKAIFQHESGGDYNAVGDAGTSHGAGQWQPATWKGEAKDILGDENAPMSKDNQRAVAQASIAKDKAAGLNPAQIAAKWNSGSPDGWENKIGTTTINGQQIKYNVPQYVKSVTDLYQQYKGQGTADTQSGYNPKPFSNPETPGQFDFTGTQDKPTDASGGFLSGLSEDLHGTNPNSLGDQLENTAKNVGNFFLPSVGDAYHDIKGDSTKTGLQQLGDAGTSALTLATAIPGIGEGIIGAKAALLGGKAAEGADVAAKAGGGLLGAVGKNAALGAGFGASGALGAGDTDPTKIAESTALGAGTGGLLGAAGNAIASKVGEMGAGTAEGRLGAQTNRLKTLSKAYKDNSRGTTNPIQTLKENNMLSQLKVDGSSKVDASALTNPQNTGSIDNLIEDHSGQASELVKNMQGTVPINDMQDEVLKAVANNPAIRDTGGVSKAQAEVKRIFADLQNSYGEDLPYQAIDNIRAGMNRVYDPAERDVARTIGDLARDYLYNGDGANAALKSAMANEAELIRARNFVEKLHGTTVPGGQLGKYFHELIGAGVGGAAGSFFGPLGGAVGAGAGSFAADKASAFSQGNYFNPIGARVGGALQKAAGSGVGKAIRGTAKAATLRGVSSVAN